MRRLLALLLPCACAPQAALDGASAGRVDRLAAPPAVDAGWRESVVVAPAPSADAELGYAVALADLDGDGRADLIMGSHQDASLGTAAGSVHLAAGQATGAGAAVELLAGDGAAEDRFGAAVASPGDLDGDGRAELAVGAWGSDAGGTNAGAVYLYSGSAELVDEDSEAVLLSGSPSESAAFGIALAGAGDVDGDGLPELVVGATGDGGTGAVYWYPSDGAGLETDSEERLVPAQAADGDALGTAVSGAGDLDGDGYDELVAGAPTHDPPMAANGGAAFVWAGGLGGPGSATRITGPAMYANDGFGKAVIGAGDVDGDGVHDLVVGAYQDDDLSSNGGAIHLFYGGPGGVGQTSDAVYTSSSTETNAFLGTALAAAGDVDGDGFADLLAGAPGATVDGVSGGMALLFYGAETGFDRTRTLTFTASDAANANRFGRALAGGADVDGDGGPDLLIGAYARGVAPLEAGAAYLFLTPCDDRDNDGFCAVLECLDTSAVTFPGAAELDSASACMKDSDGDGWGDSNPPTGVEAGQDCADTDAGVFPGAAPRDSASACMIDEDGDGWGALAPAEGVSPGTDCDDTSTTTAPGAAEVEDAAACMTDEDGDGWGDAAPAGGVTAGTDCDDGDDVTFPGAAAAEDPAACMTDVDEDGWGAVAPATGVTGGTDCDDLDEDRNPGLAEVCNEVDDDCDGLVDDDPLYGDSYYADADGDGWTSETDLSQGCTAPEGYGPASYQADCDDADPAVSPGAAEVAGDGVDQDCDGADVTWEDAGGKGCSSAPALPGLLGLLPLVILGRRRRP